MSSTLNYDVISRILFYSKVNDQ
ncbi:unnamed protein product [Acanthoscelides obtectus]|uniref:Uncharacterized protein n=1 Tax=Acanthoscelides obtectus TaxID=200917 RepID=A0A9P0M6Y1_ACAOB|nr:unnamed protein product [Acanthoscelides obtectus]CAK1645803.1 hypothetical protein AOBTE_LOCUS14285 [Acanthoscelides obtectus]